MRHQEIEKNYGFGRNRNFVQKLKLCSKIEILVKNRNFGQKSKFSSKMSFLAKSFLPISIFMAIFY